MSAGTTVSMTNVSDHEQGDDLARERGRDEAAEGDPDPGQRERVQPEHERPDDRRGHVEPPAIAEPSPIRA